MKKRTNVLIVLLTLLFAVSISITGAEGGEMNCFDGADNDSDGKIDLADTDCNATCVCFDKTGGSYVLCPDAEINDFCDSDINTPHVGFVKDSYRAESGPENCAAEETDCIDGFDNDCDGLIDCEDPDCLLYGCTIHSWGKSCNTFALGIDFGTYEQDCTDSSDNDGDGDVDCFDADCIYGNECPQITPADCTCPDLNNNGIIYQDWDDLALAAGTPDYENVYRCVQIFSPYCDDTETKDFLDWMRAEGYFGRIITIYAQAANDPIKRLAGNNANMQKYYDMRASGSTNPYVRKFKNDPNYTIYFTEVEATDGNFINNLNTEVEVQSFLNPFMDAVFSKDIEFMYDVAQINYVDTFGPYSEYYSLCSVSSEDDVCFSLDNVRAWTSSYFDLSKDNMGHWGADFLTTGENVYLPKANNMNGYVYQNDKKVNNPYILITYAHEWGHQLALPHPLTMNPYLYGGKDVVNLIGTGGLMALGGYAYGCVSMLDSLARYALEPASGYDDSLYGQRYSVNVLTSCNTDTDGDGIPDDGGPPEMPPIKGDNPCSRSTTTDCDDNCIYACNANQLDADGDGIGDVCDVTPGCDGCGQPACELSCDLDSDGILNAEDNCPKNCNTQQLDVDGDSIGDVCDPDPGCGGCGQASCEQEC